MYKIFDMRTCGLSHQIKGPTTVKLAKTGFNCKIVKFTITGPLIWCDNPQVRMSKILYINNNNFHHLGRSQMCAGGCYVFRTSKPHSRTLWHISSYIFTPPARNEVQNIDIVFWSGAKFIVFIQSYLSIIIVSLIMVLQYKIQWRRNEW